ncbi:MAG: TonB-dependent receptor [Bacteroidota bacterium]|nr:TonB-dependent receptor [Bacteroidota bacterium]
MRIKIFIIISILYLTESISFSQGIGIEADNEPLSQVLVRVRDLYGLQFSFDDRLLSKYRVTISDSFSSSDEAISALLKDLPISYEKSGDVYLIYANKTFRKQKEFLITGQVLDKSSHETLPFSHIIINGRGIVSEFKGAFSYVSRTDSIFKLSISYLGYYILDTIVQHGSNQTFYLKPSVIGLKEVRIEGEIVEHSGQLGEAPGTMRINHKIARRVPGNGDNSVFNYLRLMPGILAAGEQSGDLIIWGGYEGHSQVLFDGFTVFGLKNFNDNISAVNPYMAKDILVLKGGYGAEYGERVGGIVNISGIDGSPKDPSLDFTINNMTISGKASLPLFDQSSLVFAFRQTYYNLYDADDIKLFKNNPPASLTDMEVIPDYAFRDFNLKYSGSTKQGDNYFISLYEGRDNFDYKIDHELDLIEIYRRSEEQNRQKGGSIFYGKNWKNGFHSNLLISYSGLNRNLFLDQEITRLDNGQLLSKRDERIENQIQEIAIKNQNQFVVSEKHQFKTGLGFIYHLVDFKKDSFDIVLNTKQKYGQRLHAYLEDEIVVNNLIRIKPGIRIDYPLNISKFYLQPRLSVSVKIDKYLKIHAAWGLYNQFVSLASEVDEYGNYRYFWTVCDNQSVPVLSSRHWVGGFSYQRKNFTVNIEAYHKTIEGITRFINTNRFFEKGVYEGYGYSYGIDLYLKQIIKKHEFWISYSLGKAEESFPYFRRVEYFYAPQDQRHEVKFAGLFNLHPFYISANYVYGSGFVDLFRSLDPENRHPYSRLDASLIYRYDKKNYHMEGGISIMNLLNTENIKYSNFIRVPANQTNTINIHAEAVPFTPTIYLNFSF